MEQWWNDSDKGKIDVRGQKPVLFPFGIPKMSHGLAWNRTRVATVTARRCIGLEVIAASNVTRLLGKK
jgi:hypothetical protein